MRHLRASPAFSIGFGLVLATGCDKGGSGDRLDCAWLAGNNCWKATTALADACVPPSVESGVLSAGNTTCTYASGATVTFNLPLMISSVQFDFASSGANGQPCLTFNSSANGALTLDVGGQTVTLAATASSVTVTCPDGAKYEGQVDDLASCADQLPGFGFSAGHTYDFSLTGTPDPPGMLKVFSCAPGTAPKDNDCTVTGGTDSFPPSLCVDYTGSGNTGMNGDPEARSECQALFATCGNACQAVYYSFFVCSTNNTGTIIGSCVVNGGQPMEQVVTFYSPTTPAQAQTYCSGLGGIYRRA